MSDNKKSKSAESNVRGFESLSLRTESRSCSGFRLNKTKSGKTSGKNEFVKSIICKVFNTEDTRRLPYKLGTIYNTEEDRYVYYSYYSVSQDKYIPQKVRLNKWGLTPAERKIYLEALCEELNKELISRNKSLIYHEEAIKQQDCESILDWIDVVISEIQKEAANDPHSVKEMVKTYSGLRSNLEEFFNRHPSLDVLLPEQYNDEIVKLLIKMFRDQGRASKTINKYIWALERLLGHLYVKKVVVNKKSFEHLHVEHIKNETGKYPPLSSDQKIKVFDYYRDWEEGYYHLFLFMIYYTCIRPAELHRLQTTQFNFDRRTIFIPWYKSKNGLSNHVQILNPLYDLLIERGVHKLSKDMYLFGDCCRPSFEKYEGYYSSKTWAKQRETIGLPENIHQYGLKHTFNLDYVENNKDNTNWEWLRRHNRHATIQQTQDYIAELTAYMLDENKSIIIDYNTVPGKGLKKASLIL